MVVPLVTDALTTIVAQVLADALAATGQRRHDRQLIAKAAKEATQTLVDYDGQQFAESLTSDQMGAFVAFVKSPQFGAIVLQAVAAAAVDRPKEVTDVVRDQIQHGLRHTGAFDATNLFEATNHVQTLVDLAVATGGTRPLVGSPPSPTGRQIALQAELAAAGARNGELLATITSLHEVHKFAAAFRTSVAAHHRKIRVSHGGNTTTADYTSLYVSPHLHIRPPTTSRLPEMVEAPRALPIEVHELLRLGRRTVVLGDPGAGKSTFSAKLAHDIARDLVPGIQGLVPFVLTVRDHTTSLRADHETMLHYLDAIARRPHQLDPPARALEYLLLNGHAVVIVDGLDELGDTRHRLAFTQMVDAFAQRYPATRVIVTSRVVGYEDAPLDPNIFTAADIAPFDDAQTMKYADSFFALDGRTDPDLRRDHVAAFMAESQSASDIRRNPLMLSLLCMLYTSVNFIPANKPELYEKCAELLFEMWDRSRGLDVPHRFSAHIKPAVQRLAWKLFNDPDGRQAIPRAELAADLTEFMKAKRHPDDDEAAQAADDFIAFCTGRAWVLTDVGADRIQPHYGFVHHTFLEFFAAGQLVKNNPSPQAVWKVLRTHVNDGRWEVAGQLAVQLLDRWHEDGADELLGLAVETARTLAPADAAAVLNFCASCLTSIVPGNAALDMLAAECVNLAVNVPNDERRRLYGLLPYVEDGPLVALLMNTSPENDDRLARAIAAAVTASAHHAPAWSSAGILYSLLRHLPVPPFPKMGIRVRAALIADHTVAERADRWERLIRRPTADDVREYGILVLFERTAGLRIVLDSWVNRALWLRDRLSVETVADLSAMYPAVLERFETIPPDPAFRDDRSLATGESPMRLTVETLRPMPQSARAAAVLLFVAQRHAGFLKTSPTDPLACLVAPPREGWQQLFDDCLAALDLPPEAERHLRAYYRTQSVAAAQSGPPSQLPRRGRSGVGWFSPQT